MRNKLFLLIALMFQGILQPHASAHAASFTTRPGSPVAGEPVVEYRISFRGASDHEYHVDMLIGEDQLLDFLEGNINACDYDGGRKFQTLQQASFHTLRDGPFDTQGEQQDRSISCYDKGAIVGWFLDLVHSGQRSPGLKNRMNYSMISGWAGRVIDN